jgi:hypothetical protein
MIKRTGFLRATSDIAEVCETAYCGGPAMNSARAFLQIAACVCPRACLQPAQVANPKPGESAGQGEGAPAVAAWSASHPHNAPAEAQKKRDLPATLAVSATLSSPATPQRHSPCQNICRPGVGSTAVLSIRLACITIRDSHHGYVCTCADAGELA